MAVGCRTVELHDEAHALTIPMLVMYPSSAPEASTSFGPYVLNVAMNAPVAGDGHRLVVISHGSGGSHLVYRDLASALAREGFVVLMPEHPHNNRNSNAWVDTVQNLTHRPALLTRAIDWAYADAALGATLRRDGVAIIGHSMGGYTALAAAGARPTALARETSDGVARVVDVTPDARVQALVLLAPATPWYLAPDALSEVRAPILMRTAEHDPHTPAGHAHILLRGVPDVSRVEHQVVPGAGHFSFLTPFPPSLTRPAFAPSQDPSGFDRAAFQRVLAADVIAFLQRELAR